MRYNHINRFHPIIIAPTEIETNDTVRIKMSEERMDITVSVSSVTYGKNKNISPNPIAKIPGPNGGAFTIAIIVNAMMARDKMKNMDTLALLTF